MIYEEENMNNTIQPDKSVPWKEKPHNNIIWILVLSFVLLNIGDFLLIPILPEISKKHAFLFTFSEYFTFIATWIPVMIAVIAFKRNRFILDSIGPKSKGNFSPLVGLLGKFGDCPLFLGSLIEIGRASCRERV